MSTEPDTKDVVVVEEREEVNRKQVAQLDFSEHAMATMPASLRELSQEEKDRLHKRVVRKIDWVVMPIIMIVYILNFIDRQNLAAAKLQGILQDLHMGTEEFATAIALFNVGYLPFQIPSNLIMTRVSRPGLYICSAVSIWGLISGCTAAVQSYHALLGVRILLGAAEAVFFPGVIYYLSAWYTKKEIGKRLAIFFIGQELGNAFGGLIGASTTKLAGHHGLSAWRWLFIIEGSATVFLGIFFAIVMPEFPHNTRTLTQIERDMAVWRLEREAGAAEAHEEDRLKKGIMLLVKDVKLWILVWMSFLTHSLGSITTFFPTIVDTLGYNPTNTLLLTAPPYILACFFFFGLSWTSDRYNSIYWQVQICNALAVIVCIIPLATLSVGGRYTAMMFMPSATVCPQIFIYKTANLHMARPASKRALAAAFINSIGSAAAYWNAYIFVDPPGLHPAFFTLLAIAIAFLFTMFGYRWLVRRENRRLNGSEADVRKAMKGGVTQEQVDMGWRYECY